MPELSVSARLTCAYDGVLRLVTDAARFGFVLRELNVRSLGEGLSRADLKLGSSAEMDGDMIAHRFGRHPGIVAVEVATTQSEQKDG